MVLVVVSVSVNLRSVTASPCSAGTHCLAAYNCCVELGVGRWSSWQGGRAMCTVRRHLAAMGQCGGVRTIERAVYHLPYHQRYPPNNATGANKMTRTAHSDEWHCTG